LMHLLVPDIALPYARLDVDDMATIATYLGSLKP